MPFASSTASSSPSNVCSVRTGPKTSCLDDLHVRANFGEKRRLVVETAELRRHPRPDCRCGAVGDRSLDEAVDPLEVLARDQGPDVSVGLARITELAARHSFEEALGELVRNGLLDEEARPGEADLTRVVVLVGRLLDGRVEIGVGEDEKWRLAAELEGNRDDVLGGGFPDQPRGVDRPREGDAADVRVGDERRTRLLPETLHDVEDARLVARPPPRSRRGAST